MSLSSALSIALTGLNTSSSLLQLASNNISNAQTPGYTEKTATTAPVLLGTDAGGVQIVSYQRATDQGLTTTLNAATATASNLTTSYNYLAQVQSILNSNSTNPALSSALSNFQSAWTTLSVSPEDANAQQAVISAGTTLVSTIQTISTQMTSLAAQAQTDIGSSVKTLNADLGQLQQINVQIVSAKAAGLPVSNFQDQQDQLVKSISAITAVTVFNRSDGSVALYTTGGTSLLDNTAQTLSYGSNVITNSSGQDITKALTGGSLQAQLNFADTSASAISSTDPGTGVIAKVNAQLSKLVDALTNSSGTTNSVFATAYSSAAASSTASGGSQNGSSVASNFFTVTNDSSGNPDPSTLSVNSSLVNGTSSLPETGVQAIANSFTSTASYTAGGLNASTVTYAELGTAILSNFQQAANTLKTTSTDATTQSTYYQSTLTSETGVNVDNELVNLTALQSAYAASAHVISTVQAMMQSLESILQ